MFISVQHLICAILPVPGVPKYLNPIAHIISYGAKAGTLLAKTSLSFGHVVF